MPRQQTTDNVVRIGSHFFDSGSYGLQLRAKKYAQDNNCSEWDFYSTDEHWKYLDDYAEFVKENSHVIDLYSNVDVIRNPELTWRNQRYLERRHDLTPVPVVHFPTDVQWLDHYVQRGHEIIGLGGLVGAPDDRAPEWIHECFDLVCPPPERLPKVKLHGFGVTGFDLLIRFPWWSVDSATWTRAGAYGGVMIPRVTDSGWDFLKPPLTVLFTEDRLPGCDRWSHFSVMTGTGKSQVTRWLKEIDVPLGEGDPDEGGTRGVINHHGSRKVANLLYFDRWTRAFHEAGFSWPWAYKPALKRRRLGDS